MPAVSITVVRRVVMKTDIHVLYLNVSDDDVQGVCRTLSDAGIRCTPRRASTREEFVTALERPLFDLVLSDERVPGLTGLEALSLVRERQPHLPFIFITGSPSHELAVEAMKGGATDSVSKQNIHRLVPAVERALRRTSARQELSDLFENAPVGIVWFKPDGLVSRINQTGLQLLRTSREAVMGKPLSDLFTEPNTAREILQKARQQENMTGAEAWLQCADATRRRVVVQTTLFCQDKQWVSACCWIRDAAEPDEASQPLDAGEAEVRRIQTMEAIGRFAGGIAHDFSNILTEVLGYGRIVLDGLSGQSPLRDDVEKIIRAAEKASRITKQMMTLTRRQSVQTAPVDLNLMIQNLDKLLRRILGDKIRLVTDLASDLKPVLMDASWPEQVIMNLVLNARDMMPQGGTLTLETSNVALDTEFCRKHAGLSPGIHVLLSAQDSGLGTAPSVLEHMFEPFYLIRDGGTGNGLGLSTLYGIVQQCHGFIEARSPRGKGTEIRLYLPIAQAATAFAAPAKPATLSGTELILLVEDEEAVLNLAARQLRSLGYTVVEARNGKHALRLCKEYAQPFQLVVSDVVMPQMDGFELVRQLRQTNPDLRALFISGFPISRSEFIPDGKRDDLLMKPFTNNQLAQKLRQLLGPGVSRGRNL